MDLASGHEDLELDTLIDPVAFDETKREHPVAPPDQQKGKKKAEAKKEDREDGGGCPKDSRCAWNFTEEGTRHQGHTEWMCRCRAHEIAAFGCRSFGAKSHWVQLKSESGGAP